MIKQKVRDGIVLVGVLKNKRDLNLLLTKRWYRIPMAYAPTRKFNYLVFYQPTEFGRKGKRIEYYARVAQRKIVKRIRLLPEEPQHLRAKDDYLKFEFLKIEKLSRPIKNIIPRRISFGFTTLKMLFSARDILELYGVPSTEQIVKRRLQQLGIEVRPEFSVLIKGKRFRVDLAIFPNSQKIAIECDNLKAHAGKFQKIKDKIKDSYLRREGWRVIRLKERDIIERLDHCMDRIQKNISAPTLS